MALDEACAFNLIAGHKQGLNKEAQRREDVIAVSVKIDWPVDTGRYAESVQRLNKSNRSTTIEDSLP